MAKKKESVKAFWNISLESTCPKCEMTFDLTTDPDFWKNGRFETGEHDTEQTRNVLLACPDCGHEFRVDFVC